MNRTALTRLSLLSIECLPHVAMCPYNKRLYVRPFVMLNVAGTNIHISGRSRWALNCNETVTIVVTVVAKQCVTGVTPRLHIVAAVGYETLCYVIKKEPMCFNYSCVVA